MRSAACTLALCLVTAGCSSDYAVKKNLTVKLAAATKEMADLLETVKDRPTAEAARSKIQSLVERVDQLTERLDAIDESVGMGDEKLLGMYGEWFAHHTRMMQEQYRIGQISEAREGLGEAWQQLTGGAYDPGGVFGKGGTMDMGPAMNPQGMIRPGGGP